MYTFLYDKEEESIFREENKDNSEMLPKYKIGDIVILSRDAIEIHEEYYGHRVEDFVKIEMENCINKKIPIKIIKIAIKNSNKKKYYAFAELTGYISEPCLDNGFHVKYMIKNKLVYEHLKTFKEYKNNL